MKKLFYSLIFGLFSVICLIAQEITPATALYHYVNNGDKSYAWEVRDSFLVDNVTVKSLLLISQKWQGILWKHELLVCLPDTISQDDALIYVSGGAVQDGFPRYTDQNDGMTQAIASIAAENKAVTAILRQTPNQPLMGGLNEDALISYTLDKFGKTGDYSLPLLFPMVKSAVRAMDAIQELSSPSVVINGFVISGASKRGWTSWLSAATGDKRIIAIAPMVIDMLNMAVTLDYQQKIYGEYSDEINDYTKLNIPQAVHTDFGKALVTMIDPYSYRSQLTVPKLLTMGTNDEYWTLDAAKHYIGDIPGDNYIHFVPNVGHSLGDKKEAFATLSAFFGQTAAGIPYPECSSTVSEQSKHITLNVKLSPDRIIQARIWSAVSPIRDFRKAKWTSSPLPVGDKLTDTLKIKLQYAPKNNFKAHYIELIYNSPNNTPYSLTTRTYVLDHKRVL
ncbi:MAG: PhoPQ-activated pathogenicity-related family protein [Tannerella sp.]|jgi:PhoPQ-activated pathogenicity-related protein|nr:PhoPQ-activated pathogenicity-related family protein [Tannerella sp.]